MCFAAMVVNTIRFQILITSYMLRLVFLLGFWFPGALNIPGFLVPEALSHALTFRGNMSMLMVMDLSQ
jgi:hypothetical protein